MKKDLIEIRNGGHITPVLFRIENLLAKQKAEAIQEGYSKGRMRCLQQHRGEELKWALAEQKSELKKEMINFIKKEKAEIDYSNIKTVSVAWNLALSKVMEEIERS